MISEATGAARPGLHWWHGAVFFLAALGSQVTLFLILASLQASGALGSTAAEIEATMMSPGLLSMQVVATCGVLVALAWGATRLRRVGAISTLRLSMPPPAVLVVAGIGVIPVGIVVDEITFLLHVAAPHMFDSLGLSAFIQVFSTASTAGFILATLCVTVGPALGEELFFRGLMLRAFGVDLPPWIAVAVSAVLFGVLHLDALQGAGAILIGVYLGFVVLASGSVWPAVVAHGLNNLLCTVAARFDPDNMGQAFRVGHSPWIVAAAALLTVVTVWSLWRLRAGTVGPGGGASLSPRPKRPVS